MKRSGVLAVFVTALLTGIVVVALSQDRVLMKDVTALTFRAGAMTAGRRSSPIPQLQCRGRTCRKFQPQVVQCIRTGWDGRDATWRCEAGLPPNVGFGQTSVSCEGYSYPDDPYILAGSCGLKYQLVGTARSSHDDEDLWTIGGVVLTILITAAIAAFVISKCCKRFRSTGGGGDMPPPPPPYDDYYRMPSSRSRYSAPPTSAECRPEPAPSWSQASSGPGFFTGLGIGSLAGYAFGNRYRRNHVYTAPAYDYPRPSSSGWGSSSSSSNSSSSTSSAPTRTAFGYATTERR